MAISCKGQRAGDGRVNGLTPNSKPEKTNVKLRLPLTLSQGAAALLISLWINS